MIPSRGLDWQSCPDVHHFERLELANIHLILNMYGIFFYLFAFPKARPAWKSARSIDSRLQKLHCWFKQRMRCSQEVSLRAETT
jgi:hypothetical protein